MKFLIGSVMFNGRSMPRNGKVAPNGDVGSSLHYAQQPQFAEECGSCELLV